MLIQKKENTEKSRKKNKVTCHLNSHLRSFLTFETCSYFSIATQIYHKYVNYTIYIT